MFSLESLDTNYTYLPDVIERDTNYTTCSPWSIVDTNCTNVMSVGTVPWTLTVRCRVRRDDVPRDTIRGREYTLYHAVCTCTNVMYRE